jgi:hypothetical protein
MSAAMLTPIPQRTTRDGLMSTFWLYVRIQLMVFVFGIVGPIFLVIYFTAQPDPALKWMYWSGLFITAADVLIALAFTNSTIKADQAAADKRYTLAITKRRQTSRRPSSDHESSASSDS